MEFLYDVLPILLYLLGVVLLVILIILGIKLIQSLDRFNNLMDDVEAKVQSLNGFFHIVDNLTDTLSMVSDRVVDGLTGVISKIFRRKKKESDFDE